MKFQVPQFIEIEDKVIGPFSFKQFIYLGGGTGICFVLLRLLPTILAWFLIIPIAGFSIALAFYRVNNRPFINVVESFFKFYASPRLFIWKRDSAEKPSEKSKMASAYLQATVPTIGKSKLKDMTWQIDARKNEGGEGNV